MFYSNNVEFDSESGLFQNIHKVHVAGFRCQIQKDENNSCNFVFLVPQYSKIIAFDLKILALSLSLSFVELANFKDPISGQDLLFDSRFCDDCRNENYLFSVVCNKDDNLVC